MDCTHPERLLWPDDGVTKQGLADYYAGAAEWVLQHLIGRPLSLVRCPNGVAANCFFANHAWAGWIALRGQLGLAMPRIISRSISRRSRRSSWVAT
jgi:DNA primase